MSVIPWSFSSITSFETCARKHYLTRVAKIVKDPPTVHTEWGKKVHTALELRVRDKTPLPEPMQKWEPLAAAFDTKPGVFAETQFALTRNLKPTGWFDSDAWCRGIIDVGAANKRRAFLGDWKGLCLSTKLPTPNGWTTMRDVQVGDVLFGADGAPCTVIGKSDIHHRECYLIAFDDTTTVVCDDEHLWEVNGEVVPAKMLCASLTRYGQNWRAVRIASAIECEEAELPIHPYVFGLWLGDGKHTSGEICKPDSFVWDKIQTLGYKLGEDISSGGRCRTHTVKGIRGKLGALGVLGNKHIPRVYLRASVRQRVDLLQGLMDSDGNANTARKQVVFTTCSKQLSDDVLELLCSLGQRPLQSVTKQTGFGKTVTAFPVSFKPLNGLSPFSVPRKAGKVLPTWGSGKSHRRLIVRMEKIPTVPTQCIAVDSIDNTYLCTEKFLVTHNTGKVKHDVDELKLFSAMFMQYNPDIEVVDTGFIWLAHNQVTKEVYTRDDLPSIWQDFMARSLRLEIAMEKDKWLPKPSGLCRGWCPAGRDNCEFWSPKKN